MSNNTLQNRNGTTRLINIPDDLIFGDTSDGGIRTYLVLCSVLADSPEGGRFTRETLAEAMGVSTRTISARVKELVDKNWVTVTPNVRESDERHGMNWYTIVGGSL